MIIIIHRMNLLVCRMDLCQYLSLALGGIIAYFLLMGQLLVGGMFSVRLSNQTNVTRFDPLVLSSKNRNNGGYGALGVVTGSTVIGDSASEMGNALSEVNLGNDFVVEQLVAGVYFNCALSKFMVKCWG